MDKDGHLHQGLHSKIMNTFFFTFYYFSLYKYFFFPTSTCDNYPFTHVLFYQYVLNLKFKLFTSFHGQDFIDVPAKLSLFHKEE